MIGGIDMMILCVRKEIRQVRLDLITMSLIKKPKIRLHLFFKINDIVIVSSTLQ